MRLRLALGLVAASLLSGCDEGDTCGTRLDPVIGLDGGVYACIKAEDCPRGSNTSVCISDAAELRECARCEETRCVLSVPLRCP